MLATIVPGASYCNHAYSASFVLQSCLQCHGVMCCFHTCLTFRRATEPCPLPVLLVVLLMVGTELAAIGCNSAKNFRLLEIESLSGLVMTTGPAVLLFLAGSP
jgi:hypothetical protein